MSGIDDWTQDIHQGDAGETLAEMRESSVHCAVTSPPYFGLRDYGVDGQIGLEESLDEYIASIVEVADELRRVLRPDGNWWLNLGDSFAGSNRGQWDNDAGRPKETVSPDSGQLRRKNKMLIPHRAAIALQDAGWVVRDDAIWFKTNGMPDPVKDRLREQKELFFHLTPEPDYWFDLDAIREPHAEASIERSGRHDNAERGYPGQDQTLDPDQFVHPDGKNPGDVFEGPVAQFPDAHFATFPEWLVEAPIKSSCPQTVCADCGMPYNREIEEVNLWEHRRDEIERPQAQRAMELFENSGLTVEHLEACRATGVKDTGQGKITQDGFNDERVASLAAEAKGVLGGYVREFYGPARRDEGWSQGCDCDTDETEPGIVLDPFAGAGTTCLVSKRLGRRFVGIDLNEEYVAMAQHRIGLDVDQPQLVEQIQERDEEPLTAYTDGGNG